jgi:hypothetical protein
MIRPFGVVRPDAPRATWEGQIVSGRNIVMRLPAQMPPPGGRRALEGLRAGAVALTLTVAELAVCAEFAEAGLFVMARAWPPASIGTIQPAIQISRGN